MSIRYPVGNVANLVLEAVTTVINNITGVQYTFTDFPNRHQRHQAGKVKHSNTVKYNLK